MDRETRIAAGIMLGAYFVWLAWGFVDVWGAL